MTMIHASRTISYNLEEVMDGLDAEIENREEFARELINDWIDEDFGGHSVDVWED